MVPRDKIHVANVVSAVILGLVLCSILLLVVFLFFSPTL